MLVKESGQGPALMLVPGNPGRWQYAAPAVEALARSFHVVTFSLGMKPAVGQSEIDVEVARIKQILDDRQLERAIICGISYGGVIATSFAARHASRTSALIVASSPGTGWHLRPRHEFYARWPMVFAPLFFLESPFRLSRELAAALPSWRARLRFASWQLSTLLTTPVSASQMAARARALARHDIAADCARVTAPTLVITGERALDRVVPVESTASYVERIAGARPVVIGQTGHLGSITRPAEFAAVVEAFARHLDVPCISGRKEAM